MKNKCMLCVNVDKNIKDEVCSQHECDKNLKLYKPKISLPNSMLVGRVYHKPLEE